MSDRPDRAIENDYLAAKLRRPADSVERGEPFTIQLAGERIRVPRDGTAAAA